VWDARTGENLLECKGHTDFVKSVAFSPDGLRLATGSQDQTARVWDARTGDKLLECKGHSGGVFSVAFSPDGLRLATGSYDNTARVWDAESGHPLLECKGHTGGVMSVAFSPDGMRLATASYDKTARVWDGRSLSEAEEVEWRRWATRPEPEWHQEQADKHEKDKQWFAAAFHLRQLLAHNPADADKLKERLKRCEEKLKQP
jgi:hypothetical protein